MVSVCLLHRSSSLFFFALLFLYLQNPWRPSSLAAAALTDPSEVESLESIASKMGFNQWNFTIDPCSWNISSAPSINCTCENNTCHVINLNMYKLNVIGKIPLEIVNLTQLQVLKLGFNLFSGSIPAQLGRLTHLTAIDLGVNQLSGSVPSELGNLTELQTLKLGLNLFSGSIPAQLGRLTQLTEIDLGVNQLSGSVPSELGNLTALQTLIISSNQLSGSFPKELGQLKSLTGLYMDSSGLSGQIPVEFGNLVSLTAIWMFGTPFSGQIPDIFGNLSELETLKMYGNNFSGPIPTSLLSLPSIQNLNIGDLSNGGLIPASFKALKSVFTLSLRHNGLSGSIPEDIGNLSKLQILDLSYNNLTGRIPASFVAFSSLRELFLGSNSLQGDISMLSEISILENLDVSNNQFSGPFPAWVTRNSLEVNLLWNFFEFNETENRFPYAMFNCPDGNSPCEQTASGSYGSFAINCGGLQVTDASTQTIYSDDSERLEDSGVFQSAQKIWGVSSTGYVDGDGSFSSTLLTSSNIDGAFNQDLYQTARGAASSLRYYGAGLINGLYHVELHFAEIAIPDDGPWNSTGQRIFDVYIQGKKVLEDFNIYSAANGLYKAVVRNFTANVTNSFLEVNLLWAGKGTCCIPSKWTYGPLISAIRVNADFYVPPLPSPPASKSTRNVVVIVVSVLAADVAFFMLVYFIWRRCHCRHAFRARRADRSEVEFSNMDAKLHEFTFNELKVATQNFNSRNKLGEGGFGIVFKGQLLDGTVIAIKQLTTESNKRKKEFLNEVAAISSVQHHNLVKLLGCCVEHNRKLFVFEFLENNSLSHALFEKRMLMDWPTRFSICIGIARGLVYLHEESRMRIVHRDIKASNILLDKNLNPKIADIGLANLYQDDETHVSKRVAGTIGYLAPEYALRGKLTEKADVYSFGVLLLEIVSGRSNNDSSLPAEMVYLVEWTWQLHEENRLVDLADKSLEGNFSKEDVERVIHVALLCMQPVAAARPKMSEALSMLTSSAQISLNLTKPSFLADLEQKSVEPLSAYIARNISSNTASSSAFPATPTYSVDDDTISLIEPRRYS